MNKQTLGFIARIRKGTEIRLREAFASLFLAAKEAIIIEALKRIQVWVSEALAARERGR